MSGGHHADSTRAGVPREYRIPPNISLPYIYNWDSYDGLPVSTTDQLTWTSFPAGEPTSFLISAASKSQINQPSPINGNPVPRPADIEGNPIDINIYSSGKSSRPFDVAVSLVPKNTGPTPHVHWSDNEWFYVLAGSITLYVDHSQVPNFEIPGVDGTPLADQLYEIKVDAGQIVYGPSNMIHSFTNYSDEPAAWLTIWEREQDELQGGISQFFTRGDIAPLVLDYDASIDYFENSDFQARFKTWAETFPLYNVTIADTFGSYISSGIYDPENPNQPGNNNPNVVAGAPQAVLDSNNAQVLNSLFQNFDDLQSSLFQNNKVIAIRSASGLVGLPINLEITIYSDSGDAESYGYFKADNMRGDVDGVKPGSPRYAEKVKEKITELYSLAPSTLAHHHDYGSGAKTIAVETGQTLGFFKRDLKGNLVFSTVQPELFNLINSSGPRSSLGGVTINARLKGAIASVNDIISGHNNSFDYPLLDTSPFEKREDPLYSSFDIQVANTGVRAVGYYRVANSLGDVIDSSGQLVSPGTSGYREAALSASNLASDLNQVMASALDLACCEGGTFSAGDIYAPFVTVQQETGKTVAYFAFDAANISGDSHIVSTGTNSFAFRESAASKGFHDLAVKASFALEASEHDDFHPPSGQVIEIQNYGVSKGSLVFYRVDPVTGSVNGLKPGDRRYLNAAYDWGKRNDTIIEYAQLPDLNASLTYEDLGLNPLYSYGMLYVKRNNITSSYADANHPGKRTFGQIRADASLTYGEIGLNPLNLYRMLFVDGSKKTSSYPDAYHSSEGAFVAYGSEHSTFTYGLEASGRITADASFNDLVITSTVDNIAILS